MKHVAIIREPDCIGCTKCIDACPVDAILGSNKFMHTVIADECIGCKLCIPPCPVDCIELVTLPNDAPRIPPEHVKRRYQARKMRLNKGNSVAPIIIDKKNYLLELLQRTKNKNNK